MSIQLLPNGRTPKASQNVVPQVKFIRCVGRFVVRDRLSRDVACLLELDEAITCWGCQSLKLRHGPDIHVPDFMVERKHDVLLLDVVSQRLPPSWTAEAAAREGFTYQTMARGDIDPVRLKNCKDLLQTAGGEVSLGDRVRMLAALDEHSSLTVAESLTVFRDSNPIRALANMVVERFLEIDLDQALIGPETLVRRYRG